MSSRAVPSTHSLRVVGGGPLHNHWGGGEGCRCPWLRVPRPRPPAPAPQPPAPRGPGHSPHCAHLLTSCDMCVRVHTVLVWDCPPPHTHTRTHTAHRMSSTPVPSAPRKGAGRSCSRSPPGRSGVGPAGKPSTVTTMRNRTWSPSSRRGWTGALAPTTCSAPGQPPPRGPAARPEVGPSSHGVGVWASGPCRPQPGLPPARVPGRWRCTAMAMRRSTISSMPSRRCATPAGCSCSVPNAMKAAELTTSCAAVRGARETRGRRASTCRSKTT